MQKASTKINIRKLRKRIFIFLMLAYPVAHFLIFWIFVNFNSVLLAFQRMLIQEQRVVWTLDNFRIIWNMLRVNNNFQQMILNSLSYVPIISFISLPLAIISSYFMFKKIPGAPVYRVLFFLPSIIPLIVLTIAFQMALDPIFGMVPNALDTLTGSRTRGPVWFGDWDMAQFSIYLFMIWSGLGFSIILLSSAMARLPREILEYSKLDGAGAMRELFSIYIPLIWPTITTLFVLGLMGFFGIAMQPMFLTGTLHETLGLRIFLSTRGGANVYFAAALGLAGTLIVAPIILTVRFIMERFHRDVSF